MICRVTISAQRAYKAQALSEYTVIGALILVLSVPALYLLGGNIYSGFNNILGSSNATTAVQANTSTSAAAGSSGTANSSQPSAISTMARPNGNGSPCYSPDCLNAAAGTTVTVSTVGSLGNDDITSAQYVQLYDRLAQLAQTDPDMDPQLKALLINLALNGHSVADQELMVYQTNGGANAGNLQSTLLSKTTSFTGVQDSLLSYLSDNPQALPKDTVQWLKSSTRWMTHRAEHFNADHNTAQDAVTGTHIRSNGVCSLQDNTGKCVR